MSEKQIIWLGIGLGLVTYNPLNLFNGLDLLGWIVLSYTIYRIIEDRILFNREKAKWQKIIL